MSSGTLTIYIFLFRSFDGVSKKLSKNGPKRISNDEVRDTAKKTVCNQKTRSWNVVFVCVRLTKVKCNHWNEDTVWSLEDAGKRIKIRTKHAFVSFHNAKIYAYSTKTRESQVRHGRVLGHVLPRMDISCY